MIDESLDADMPLAGGSKTVGSSAVACNFVMSGNFGTGSCYSSPAAAGSLAGTASASDRNFAAVARRKSLRSE